MKVVLFCGGLGTRIREYSEEIPKPMIPVGQQPILWHVMNYYSHHGHRDFVLCLGYKANTIKQFFLNRHHTCFSDCIISERGRKVEFIGERQADWRVALVDTGMWRNVGERLYAVREHVKDEEIFLANYSDGLSDLPLPNVIEFMQKQPHAAACFLGVAPYASYHMATVEPDGKVKSIKQVKDTGMRINGGYFVLRPEIFDWMKPGEELVQEPFQRLCAAEKLVSYAYDGFWACMDTFKDKQLLEDLYSRGAVPWEVWKKNSKGE